MIKVVGIEKTLSRKGKETSGYKIESKEGQVVRSEYDLRAFHKQLSSSMNMKDIQFPLEEYRAGLDWLMPLVVVVAIGVGMAKNVGNTDPRTPFIVGGLGFVVIFAIGLFRYRGSSGKQNIQPLQEYFDRIAKLVGKNQETDAVINAFLELPLRYDWAPRFGPIDLAVHDLPHASAATEWWYYNGHLQCGDREVSVFVCFFRFLKHYLEDGTKIYSHALTWALTDVKNGQYYRDCLLENDSPKYMLAGLKQGKLLNDPILKKALQEILEKDNVPQPDRLFKKNPKIGNDVDELILDYEEASLYKDASGAYKMTGKHHLLPCGFELTFHPKKAPIHHMDHGLVKGNEGDDMFYYCITRLDVTGTVTLPKMPKLGEAAHTSTQAPDVLQVTSGNGWYDHEFGGKPESEWEVYVPSKTKTKEEEVAVQVTDQHVTRYAWNWFALQLDDNTEVTGAHLINPDTAETMELRAVYIDENGIRTQHDESEGVIYEANMKTGLWTSVRTFVTYPTEYHLVVPQLDLDITVKAVIPDQEFVTLMAKPAFWEGRVEVTGTKGGKPVSGLGFVERNGFSNDISINQFFKNVGKRVRQSVEEIYPLRPTYEQGLNLIANDETEHYMKGVPLDIIGDTLIKPVREVADRGGKSWRSYGALACVDCVGGDARQFIDWIAMPEFLHVGSLIVDDIQDQSETRRGGPAAHHIYGEPLCINAGTAAYFQCEQLLRAPGLSAEDMNKLYALYFSALRGAHAGQALDINGLDVHMPGIISGETSCDDLEEKILAIHMLKTAVPAGVLARMGALVGRGSDEQIEAMGRYFESIGVAFQIMDDVLNLRGLYSKESDKLKKGTTLKRLGEDIVDGKCTFPVAKAMRNLKTKEQRAKLWETISSKPQDQKIVDKVIQQLEDLGAIDECVQQAEKTVEDAWIALDKVIPDSFAKMMLRSFGWFVIERVQ